MAALEPAPRTCNTTENGKARTMPERPPADLSQARADVIHVCHRMYQRGFVAANDGNVSARLPDDRVLVTPAGRSKGFLAEEDLIVIDLEGRVLEGRAKPSSEYRMHTALYRARPDVHGMAHAHPVTATGFAVAGIPLANPVLPEIIVTLGSIPIAPYGCPGTPELPEKILPLAERHDAFLLENHGVLTLGPTVIDAYHRLEAVEQFARISLVARLLGGERPLPEERVRELVNLRGFYGVEGRNPLG
jgi:L-fuculose-phosphate aldolase